MTIQKEKINTTLVAALLSVFAVMLVFNFLTPLAADDFVFRFNQAARTQRVTSIGELFQSLAYHRKAANGRILAHFFVQVFLLMPKAVFNVVNAANSTLLAWLIYRFVKSGDERRDAVLLGVLLAMLWVLTPAFGQVFLWLTGACNYTWCTTLSLAFLLPYFGAYMETESKERKNKALSGAALCLLGFAAGSYSENGAFAMLTVSFCLMALTALRQRKLQPALLLPFLCACGGYLFLMLAPSELGTKNNAVYAGVGPALIYRLIGLLERLSGAGLVPYLILGAVGAAAVAVVLYRRNRRLFYTAATAVTVLAVLALTVVLAPHNEEGAGLLCLGMDMLSDVKLGLLLLFGLWAVLLLAGLKSRIEVRKLTVAAVLGLGAFVSVAIFVVSSYFPARSGCQAAFYTILADGLLLSGLWEKGRGGIREGFCRVFAVLFILSFALGAVDIASSFRQNRQREKNMAQALEDGEKYIFVEQIHTGSKYSAVWANESQSFSVSMARTYGFKELWILGLDYYQEDYSAN